MSLKDMRQYLEHVADLRVARLGLKPLFGSKNPFAFLQLQDLRELTHFFERRVSAYQVGVTGKVKLDGQF
jgi:ribonucleoside-diphosphate reductase beta chain